MSRDFFVADFEFTQYTKRMGRPRGFFSEIIEIGAVKIDGISLAVTGKIQNFVHPHFYPKQNRDMYFAESVQAKKELASIKESEFPLVENIL